MSSGKGAMQTLLHKAHYWTDKMAWGMRVAGAGAALRGVARMGYLYMRRPRRSRLRLRSGEVLEFAFPSQLPRALLMFGDYVDPEFAFLRKVARPDWIVADVGAAIGQFTIFAATLPVACVHAFEPSGANFETLSENVVLNARNDRVRSHKIAFSNADSESMFETTTSNWVSGLSDKGSERVSVRTLSGEFERLGLSHVSVLKINVAGFEPPVLEAAQDFLAKGGADILILLLGLASLPWYAKIAGLGYRFFYFHPEENTLYEVTAFDASSVLDFRPWPARHILAIHHAALADLIGKEITIRKNRDNSTAP
jgi:FkbM family methyltransferase